MTVSSYYSGSSSRGRANAWRDLPVIDQRALHHPSGYLAPPGLTDAVNVALELGMPLLLTGEPGSGKSRLAASVAWELGFPESDPFEFVVKSDTEGRDLFYSFDTVGRFRAAQTDAEAADPRNYITFDALGLAILHAKARSDIPSAALTRELEAGLPDEPRRCVVLIDEIDKAPRDVPNDILTEIDQLRFTIPELRRISIGLDTPEERARQPVVIITSNSEKSLPDAFLRRCVYYHIPFPEFEANDDSATGPSAVGGDGGAPAPVTVRRIVERRLGTRFIDGGDALLDQALSLFRFLREERHHLGKRPSIAELLSWLYLLSVSETPPDLDALDRDDLLLGVKCTLLKNEPDQQRVAALVDGWYKTRDGGSGRR